MTENKGDLISREALRRIIKTECNPYGKPTIDFESGKKVLNLIDNAPTVEITDYDTGYRDGLEDGLNDIRPKGEWVDSGVSAEGIRVFRCSVCRREIASNCLPQDRSAKYPFCNCGADMRGANNG